MLMASLGSLAVAWGVGAGGTGGPGVDGSPAVDAPAVVAGPGTPRPPFRFEGEDEALLDAVQLGCLNYFLDEIDPVTRMVLDRTGARVISVAGVGFQLTVLCIAHARGWLEPGVAEKEAGAIVDALWGNPENRVRGVFYHYLEPGTAGPSPAGYERVPSTIDTALLFAGLLTAGQHFGGEIREKADDLVLNADWRSYVIDRPSLGHLDGYISLAWRPRESDRSFNEGLLPNVWADAGDEQRLTVFMARLPTDPDKRVADEMYYRMRRTLGTLPDGSPLVWFPWSGALFTAFFSHLWIDYAHRGPDDPAAWGVADRPRVDWWENSRRTAVLHRLRAIENPLALPGFGVNLWGLSASDAEGRYAVPGHFPALAERQTGEPGRDHLIIRAEDEWGDGTVAPYTAGSTIMFEPGPAVAALRHYRHLAETAAPGLWADPGEGGHGFADAFRPGPDGTVAWVAKDRVAIDAGPLLIAIENARSGFVWKTFMAHPAVQELMARRPGGGKED